jgi:uncharacterized protein (DUF736 family)
MENTTSNTNENNNEELGALWKRTARNSGQTYLAGHLKGGDFGDEGVKVVVFSNKNKTNERAPDFRIYKSKPVDGSAPAPVAQEATAKEGAEEILD